MATLTAVYIDWSALLFALMTLSAICLGMTPVEFKIRFARMVEI